MNTVQNSNDDLSQATGTVTDDGYIISGKNDSQSKAKTRSSSYSIGSHWHDVSYHFWQKKWQIGCGVPANHAIVGIGMSAIADKYGQSYLNKLVFQSVAISLQGLKKTLVTTHCNGPKNFVGTIPGQPLIGIPGQPVSGIPGQPISGIPSLPKKTNSYRRISSNNMGSPAIRPGQPSSRPGQHAINPGEPSSRPGNPYSQSDIPPAEQFVRAPYGYIVTGLAGRITNSNVTMLKLYYRKYDPASKSLTGKETYQTSGKETEKSQHTFNVSAINPNKTVLTGVYVASINNTFTTTNVKYGNLNGDETLNRFISIINDFREENKLVGISAGMYKNGHTWQHAFGYSNKKSKRSMAFFSMVRWASISKMITTVAALKMVENNKFELTNNATNDIPFTIREIIDAYNLSDLENAIHEDLRADYTSVSMQQLLNNTSGIGNYEDIEKYILPYTIYDPLEALSTWANDKENVLTFSPGTDYKYTTYGFNLAAAVINEIAKAEYDINFVEFVKEHISHENILNMKTLQPDIYPKKLPYRVTGYSSNYVEEKTENVSWKLGGGGWISSIQDLRTFMVALKTKDSRLLNSSSFDEIFDNNRYSVSGSYNYGLGCEIKVNAINSHTYIGHGGYQSNASTFLFFSEDKDLGFAVLTNSHWAWDRDELLRRLDTEFY